MQLTQMIKPQKRILFLSLALAIPFLFAPAAWAHHPQGGETPDNLIQGFLSGLGHPVVDLDHLAFVIATGLVAIGLQWGIIVPIAFLATALFGTSVHLRAIEMPSLELAIASSVMLFGVMLVMRYRNTFPAFENTAIVAALSAIAGIFHGYAYGEAIIGAEMTPLVSYLAGFTVIQGGIALASYGLGKQLFQSWRLSRLYSGLMVSAIGVVFFSQAL